MKYKKVYLHSSWGVDEDSIGFNGFDVACYLGSGVSIWPCGACVDVDEKNRLYCHCETCDAVRKNPRYYLAIARNNKYCECADCRKTKKKNQKNKK